jgi:hypothetical protein
MTFELYDTPRDLWLSTILCNLVFLQNIVHNTVCTRCSWTKGHFCNVYNVLYRNKLRKQLRNRVPRTPATLAICNHSKYVALPTRFAWFSLRCALSALYSEVFECFLSVQLCAVQFAELFPWFVLIGCINRDEHFTISLIIFCVICYHHNPHYRVSYPSHPSAIPALAFLHRTYVHWDRYTWLRTDEFRTLIWNWGTLELFVSICSSANGEIISRTRLFIHSICYIFFRNNRLSIAKSSLFARLRPLRLTSHPNRPDKPVQTFLHRPRLLGHGPTISSCKCTLVVEDISYTTATVWTVSTLIFHAKR